MDAKIFALSILLSSTLIFNQIGHITENSLEELSLVLNIASMFSGDEAQDQFFPQLVWLLRDFTLDLGSLTPNGYLDQCLQAKDGPDTERKNAI